jgi:hypothetical protein
MLFRFQEVIANVEVKFRLIGGRSYKRIVSNRLQEKFPKDQIAQPRARRGADAAAGAPTQ